MKEKIRMALASLLVLALMTGCVFTPPTAKAPQITMKSRSVSATETIEFTIDNYISDFKYEFSVNKEPAKAVQDGKTFKIAPVAADGRWALDNELTVKVMDGYGNIEVSSVKFEAVAKNTVTSKAENGKLTLSIRIETDPSAEGKALTWKVWFTNDDNAWISKTTEKGATSVEFDIPANAGLLFRYEVYYDKGNNEKAVLSDGSIMLPVKVAISGLSPKDAYAEEDGSFRIALDCQTSAKGLEWIVELNGKNLSKKILRRN